uniref:Retrotransposon gag domain-containing protein n=1 Tax=Brassica oleracea var. oleracea TaxID=109376 RepID=A0A0D3BVB1_BRAOL
MGGLYKELTMYPCKTMEDVLSRAWAQVKWEEDVASRAKAQPKQDQRSARSDRGDQEERSSQKGSKNSGSRNRGRFQYRPQEMEEGMSVSTWPDISHLSISTPELVNTLRQMGQQVKLPPKMKAPNSFRNPELWCRFHHDHGHKTEDCIPLKIEVNELLQKGHLREFLSEKAKAHLSKETTGKSKGAAPASPPRQDRVIHVISGGSEVGGVTTQPQGKASVNDTRNWGSFRRSRTLDHSKNPRNPRRTDVDRSAWSPPKPFKVASARKTWSSQDPRPPPHIDKITKNLIRYQPVVSRVSEWGMSIPRRLPQRVYQTGPERRAPRRHRMEKLSQAGDLRTWSLQWMNVTTRFMEVLKTFISRKQWSPNTEGRGMKRVSTTVPRPKKEAELCRRRRNPPARTLIPKASQDLRVQETFDPGQPLMISDVECSKVWHLGFHTHQHPLSLIVAFSRKHHAARELDSDQLTSGRMRYPNRPQGQKPIWFPKKTSGSKNHVSNSRPQGPEPTGSPKRPPGPKLIKTLQVTPGS